MDIYSNAFNFSAHLGGSVDLRTGQYGCLIRLVTLSPKGPLEVTREIALSFSMMDTRNIPYGKGWNLSNTEFDSISSKLTLLNGEQYLTQGLPSIGQNAVILDHKLKDLTLKRVDQSTLHVLYKDGTLEILRRLTTGRPFKIMAIQFENGERLSFEYTNNDNLQRIVDEKENELLVLRYSGGSLVTADTRLEGNRYARTRFEHSHTDNQLTKVTVPYDLTGPYADEGYSFQYLRLPESMVAISQVLTPMGGQEIIRYNLRGHQYEGGLYIPVVTTWEQNPGRGQPSIMRSYRYSPSRNFTGYPYNGGFRQGQDNLYRVDGDYFYWGEETYIDSANQGAQLRYTRVTYNRFHLITEELVLAKGSQVKTETVYNEVRGLKFPDQPANLQLPSRITKTFELYPTGSTPPRTEVVSITTDDFGNELSRTEASGVRTEYAYYPVTGEPGKCPADPLGLFQRYLKLEKLFPARSTTAARTTEHSHTGVSMTGGGYFVMPLAVDLEGGTQTSHTYHSEAANPALHGRLKSSTMTIDELSLVTDFTYTLNGDSITEVRSLKGREPGQWLESARTWSLTNQRLFAMTRDSLGSLEMTYDAGGRLTSETAAPGKPQMARRRYAYHFSAGAKMAHMVTTDAQGTVLFTYFDGMGRQLSAAQSLDGIADNDRLLGSWGYDALGRLVKQTRLDYLGDGPRTLKTSHAYNIWGNPWMVTQPDGRVVIDEYDPLLNRRVTGGQGGAQLETWFNEHNQPARVERVSAGGARIVVETRTYDGLGRCTERVDARKTRTEYTYDIFDRVVRSLETPSDGTPPRETLTTYALGTSEPMVRTLTVDRKLVGTREYDSLDRVISQARGSATATTWEYKPNQIAPVAVTSPRGDRQEYGHDPELETLTSVKMAGHAPIDLEYDPISGAMRQSLTAGLKHEMSYDENGYLAKEVQTLGSQALTSLTSYSPGGRLLRHSSADGQHSDLVYDQFGRLQQTTTGFVRMIRTYDSLGRLSARILNYQMRLTDSVTFDAWGRESERKLEQDGALLQNIVSTYYDDGLLATRTLKDANDAVVTGETFTYDGYSRLKSYVCEGTQYPMDKLDRAIKEQRFSYDGLDNMTEVRTTFIDGSSDRSERFFQGKDPACLTHLTHTNPVRNLTLSYDASGNLQQGTFGRGFTYNGFDQLTAVQTATDKYSYQYDGEARQVLAARGNEAPVMLAYAGDRLDTLAQVSMRARYVRDGDQVVAYRDSGNYQKLLVLDGAGSVRGVVAPITDQVRRHYAPYGDARIELRDDVSPTMMEMQLPAYNGERLDVPVNLYHLGNGRRAYDPELMVFLSPDPLSPFDEGGINSYAYCGGDPVNWSDPSGLFSFPTWARWALTGVALGMSVATAGLATAGLLAAIGAQAAALTIAGKTALLLASGAASVGGTLGIAALSVEAVDNQMGWDRSSQINVLNWASLTFAVVGVAASLGGAGIAATGASRAVAAAASPAVRSFSLLSSQARAGLQAAGKLLTGASYKFFNDITLPSQAWGMTRFGLRVVNLYRSVDGRIRKRQPAAPIGGGAENLQQPLGQPQPAPQAHRLVDMSGSSFTFHETFSQEASRVRQPILAEWNSA